VLLVCFTNALPACVSCTFVHWMCASGERDAVRGVPMYLPGRGSSRVREPIVRPDRAT